MTMSKRVGRNLTLEMGLASLEAKRKLDRQRIFMPTRPESDFPGLPDDPTEPDDSELMTLFVRLTKWAEFLSAQQAAAEVDERYAEAALDKIKAIEGYDFRKPDARARAGADQDYLDANDVFQRAYAYRKLVSVAFANAERNSTLLSRELTRRVNRIEREGRVERWSS